MTAAVRNPAQDYTLGKSGPSLPNAGPLGAPGSSGAPIRSVELLSMKFKSDHGLLTQEETSFDESEERYREPEWLMGEEEGMPISHSADTKVKVVLDVMLNAPRNTGAVYVTISGKGMGLDFPPKRVMLRPTGEPVKVQFTSKQPLKNQIRVRNLKIVWDFDARLVNGIAHSGPIESESVTTKNEILITAHRPKRPENQVTYKRLRMAVSLAGGKIDPIEVVQAMMEEFNKQFKLMPNPPSTWDFAKSFEDPSIKGDCRSISSLVTELTALLGLKGKAKAVLVYPKYRHLGGVKTGGFRLKKRPVIDDFKAVAEDAPEKGLIGGLEAPSMFFFAGSEEEAKKSGKINPLDLQKLTMWGTSSGASSPNNFEGCVEYTVNGKASYFPGGASTSAQLGPIADPKKVINVMFHSLGWMASETKIVDGEKMARAHRIEPPVKRFPW